MKIIYNNILPFKGFIAITIWPFLFVRKAYKPLAQTTLNHENIHAQQQKEMLWIFFFLWYGIECFLKSFWYKGMSQAYEHISFEREAYVNQDNLNYLKTRKWYSFLKYL